MKLPSSCLFWKLISQNHITISNKLGIRQPFIFGLLFWWKIIRLSYVCLMQSQNFLLFQNVFFSPPLSSFFSLYFWFYSFAIVHKCIILAWVINCRNLVQFQAYLLPFVFLPLFILHKIFIRNSLQLVRSLKSYWCGKFGLLVEIILHLILLSLINK